MRSRLVVPGRSLEVGGRPQANPRTNGYSHVLGGYACRIGPVRAAQPQTHLPTIFENGKPQARREPRDPKFGPRYGRSGSDGGVHDDDNASNYGLIVNVDNYGYIDDEAVRDAAA